MLYIKITQNIVTIIWGLYYKAKKNSIVRCINFWGYPKRGYHNISYFNANNYETDFVFALKLV